MSEKISRRDFLRKSAVGLAGLTVVPSAVLGKAAGHTAPSDKLNIAAVGIGGMGAANLQNMETENIVALCDVDWKYAKNTFDRYPNAKRYWDYRKMLDEMGKDIDAVLVATADHTHCLIAADAITMGKHVYVQKPLTHTVYESRLLTKLAEKYGVATQMGNRNTAAFFADFCFRIENFLYLYKTNDTLRRPNAVSRTDRRGEPKHGTT